MSGARGVGLAIHARRGRRLDTMLCLAAAMAASYEAATQVAGNWGWAADDATIPINGTPPRRSIPCEFPAATPVRYCHQPPRLPRQLLMQTPMSPAQPVPMH